MELPSPVTSVVIPCVTFETARPSTRTLYSDWPRRSTKPGATTRPRASILLFAAAFLSSGRVPTAAIRSERMATSEVKAGAPVPSTTRPPSKTRSSVSGSRDAAGRKRASAERPRSGMGENLIDRASRPAPGSAPGPGLVDPDRTAVELGPVQSRDRLQGVAVGHLDEAVSLRPAARPVDDDRCRQRRAVGPEELSQA